jgi:ribosome-binding factor A
MPSYRRGRINDAVAQELAVCLRDARDPRIIDNFVSITRAEVAPDLKVARVYYSALGDAKAAGEGLRAAQGMLRRHLAMTLNLRITPELLFYADGSIEHGARIARILEEIGAGKSDKPEGEGTEDGND